MKKVTQITCFSWALALIMPLSSMTCLAGSTPKPNATYTITPENIATNNPSTDGQNYVYYYEVLDGGSVTDELTIQTCLTDDNRELNPDPAAWSFDLKMNGASGNLANKVTVTPTAGSLAFTSGATLPDCKNWTISIDTGALFLPDQDTAVDYVANLAIQEDQKNPTNLGLTNSDPKNIKIHVNVLPNTASNVSCFLTDSSGLFLTDCDGNDANASGSTDGRFVIVTNKKSTEVATNPGQFYYNWIWRNTTGSAKTVNVDFSRYGVVPHGRQAIHAVVVAQPFNTVTQTDFNLANAVGVPEGTDDKVLNANVPNGQALYVTYHLEWQALGTTVPNDCGSSCPYANQLMRITGTVSPAEGVTGVTSESCFNEAKGYKK